MMLEALAACVPLLPASSAACRADVVAEGTKTKINHMYG